MAEKKPLVPLVQYFRVDATEPSLEDNTADIDRLKQALKSVLAKGGLNEKQLIVPFARTGAVAADFRAAGFKGYALVNILPGIVELVDFCVEEPQAVHGVALDLGTTHLEATLLDLRTGKRIAGGNKENGQIAFGSDILTRIHHAVPIRKGAALYEELSGLQELQQSVIGSINDLVSDLARKAGIAETEIRAISVSGNTTMVHLFMGLNPYHICREPYTPLINQPDPFHAGDLGIKMFQMAPVWVLPSIGSYFGGDLISGILAGRIDVSEETCMLIDVGTNAEVVLGNKDWLIACAGAAGPALEGGVAKMGMRAAPGAVENVVIDTGKWRLEYKTIDGNPPVGICGSGLIDLVAQLYLARIIDFRGKLREKIEPESNEHEQFLGKRLCRTDDGYQFIVAFADETGNGLSVILTQTDLDALMRSKAAMYAILTTLIAQVGVEFEELEKIYVAGAFGKHINPHHAVTLGMIPDLPLATYESIGNSSLTGAELILQSEEYRERSMKIRHNITYLELNVNQEFMIRFSGGRVIPHTEPSLFPSVPIYH